MTDGGDPRHVDWERTLQAVYLKAFQKYEDAVPREGVLSFKELLRTQVQHEHLQEFLHAQVKREQAISDRAALQIYIQEIVQVEREQATDEVGLEHSRHAAREQVSVPEKPTVQQATAEATLHQPHREQLIGPLRVVALLVPQRLWDEEIGDALEFLETLENSGAPRWQMRLKIWSAVFWVLINSGREVVAAALGKSKSGSPK